MVTDRGSRISASAPVTRYEFQPDDAAVTRIRIRDTTHDDGSAAAKMRLFCRGEYGGSVKKNTVAPPQ
ncbi:MAG TPA: hypothetical protein VN764_05825 [Polyangiaceae bacterium]|nr:hypothetical protein [Polyangiaceae bacterium]